MLKVVLFLVFIFAYYAIGFHVFVLFLCIIIISSLSGFFHELGHYLVSLLFGYRPHYFIFGVKTRIFGIHIFNGLIKFRFFKTNVRINLFGQSGSVESISFLYSGSRFKTALIAIAGLLVNLCIAACLYYNYEHLIKMFELLFKQNTEHHVLMSYCIFLIWCTMAINLIYFIYNMLINIKGTDGWNIIQLYSISPDPSFNNVFMHRDDERLMLDENSYNNMLKPFYDTYLA